MQSRGSRGGGRSPWIVVAGCGALAAATAGCGARTALDVTGALVAETTLFMSDGGRPALKLARFDDGTLLVVSDNTLAGGQEPPVGTRAQAFTEAGEPLSQPVAWPGWRPSAVLGASGVRVFAAHHDNGPVRAEALTANTFDERGALGPNILVGDVVKLVGRFDVTPRPHGAIAVSGEWSSAESYATVVRWNGPDATPVGAALRLDSPFVPSYRVVSTSNGGAVIFEMNEIVDALDPASLQVFARALTCP